MKGNKPTKKDSKPKKKSTKKGSSRGKKGGFFSMLFKFINIVCIVLMLLAYTSQYVSPAKFTLIAFVGLAYPPILLANSFCVILWMILRKRMFIYSLIVILVGWNVMFNHIHIGFNIKDEIKSEKIKILSYNVHNLRMESKIKNKVHNFKNELVDFVKEENPAIACFQEFFSSGHKDSLANDSLIRNLDYKYSYYFNYISKTKKYTMDALAIFSKYPIISRGSLTNNEKEKYTIYADIIINEDTVRLYNIHLTSIHLGSAIDSAQTKSAYKLWKAFKMRAYEVDILKKEMERSPYPIILCGDFNDTPASYSYHQLTSNLDDTFSASNTTIGNTYYWEMTPIRIDYILHNKMYKSSNYKVNKLPYSDHYPVTATIYK